MKIWWTPLILIAATGQALGEESMPWASDYTSAQTTAAATGKLILIEFTSPS